MSPKEAFDEALIWYIHIGDTEPGETNAARALFERCGAVWNLAEQMPENSWHDVRDAIENWVDADQWEKTGRTYSGAARRIRPQLLKRLSNAA